MARDPAEPARPIYAHPWFVILAALALSALGWLAGVASLPNPLRILLVVAGTLTAIAGLRMRFREGRWEFIERVETAAMIATAGLGSLLAWYGMNENWESGRVLFGLLFGASLGGTFVVLLPTLLRKIALSLLILFHFGGMATAVTSVDPPNSTGPWLSKQLWTRVYRPYLSVLYLTNAYHFYSPDPGPPSLFWFAVQYEDGSYTWVKLPERSQSPIGMHYQRMLALPEHTFSQNPRLPYTQAEISLMQAQSKDYRPPERGSWEEICRRRELGSTRSYPAEVEEDGKKVTKGLPIPMVYGMQDVLQYREPHDTSKMLVATVAKRIFWNAPPSKSGSKVKSVKMYRVTHMILTPAELARGVDPLDKTKHWAYFLGEFDGEGKLLDKMEPFLYWYVPIQYVPKNYTEQLGGNLGAPTVYFGLQPGKDNFLLDGLEMHAAGEVRKQDKKEEKQ